MGWLCGLGAVGDGGGGCGDAEREMGTPETSENIQSARSHPSSP